MTRFTAPSLAATALTFAASLMFITPAAAFEIQRVAPNPVERGNTLTLVGNFGEPSDKEVAIFSVVNGQPQDDIRAMQVAVWTPSVVKAFVPPDLAPADAYGVVIRSTTGLGFSNWMPVQVATVSGPRWPLRSGEVMANRCQVRDASQGHAGPCITLSHIGGVNTMHAFPGGRLLLNGNFENLQAQVIALVRTDYVYTPEVGASIYRNFAHHLLTVLRRSPNEIVVGIPTNVYPGQYTLVVVNPLPEFGADPIGAFEKGSNGAPVAIRAAF
jgi:hypothetical protein